jgi:hypothetical protein
MSRPTPDQIIAHIDLLRAVDRLLTEADTVRAKRETLLRLAKQDGSQHEQRNSEVVPSE